jgi:hypothetical protein
MLAAQKTRLTSALCSGHDITGRHRTCAMFGIHGRDASSLDSTRERDVEAVKMNNIGNGDRIRRPSCRRTSEVEAGRDPEIDNVEASTSCGGDQRPFGLPDGERDLSASSALLSPEFEHDAFDAASTTTPGEVDDPRWRPHEFSHAHARPGNPIGDHPRLLASQAEYCWMMRLRFDKKSVGEVRLSARASMTGDGIQMTCRARLHSCSERCFDLRESITTGEATSERGVWERTSTFRQ